MFVWVLFAEHKKASEHRQLVFECFFMVERDAPNPNPDGSDKISMVEARGIEPLSEKFLAQLSTSVVYHLNSLYMPPTNRLQILVTPNTHINLG